MNPEGHIFWWALTLACVIWYLTITVYVAFKGVFDIQGMLQRLSDKAEANNQTRE